MIENEGQATGRTGDENSLPESPADKLENKPPTTGSLTPGAENPESEEIKGERSPNSE